MRLAVIAVALIAAASAAAVLFYGRTKPATPALGHCRECGLPTYHQDRWGHHHPACM